MLVLKVCLTFAQTHVICVICALCLCYKCSLLAMARRFAADNSKIFVPPKRILVYNHLLLDIKLVESIFASDFLIYFL